MMAASMRTPLRRGPRPRHPTEGDNEAIKAKESEARRQVALTVSPAVVRPLSFVAIGGPTWGPKPTCHATGAPVTRCGKIAPPLAPIPRLLGAIAED
jgi:hypothetical protein